MAWVICQLSATKNAPQPKKLNSSHPRRSGPYSVRKTASGSRSYRGNRGPGSRAFRDHGGPPPPGIARDRQDHRLCARQAIGVGDVHGARIRGGAIMGTLPRSPIGVVHEQPRHGSSGTVVNWPKGVRIDGIRNLVCPRKTAWPFRSWSPFRFEVARRAPGGAAGISQIGRALQDIERRPLGLHQLGQASALLPPLLSRYLAGWGPSDRSRMRGNRLSLIERRGLDDGRELPAASCSCTSRRRRTEISPRERRGSQRNQSPDDGDHHQQLNQRESMGSVDSHLEAAWLLCWITMRKKFARCSAVCIASNCVMRVSELHVSAAHVGIHAVPHLLLALLRRELREVVEEFLTAVQLRQGFGPGGAGEPIDPGAFAFLHRRAHSRRSAGPAPGSGLRPGGRTARATVGPWPRSIIPRRRLREGRQPSRASMAAAAWSAKRLPR